MSEHWAKLTHYFLGLVLGAVGAILFGNDGYKFALGAAIYCAVWLLGSLCYYQGKKARRSHDP